ncbi:hypothetical protein CPB83DRAFT_627411 [Crepidotus variabilis]|uniref:Uncharacterized protein n=1 Tax=Crepidotus variabilis TaxID=179855 RepID=A0A9P6JU76_9AGAR|nr:hypothetical protein CPB83DRAFT_627411 [Crepidotus variabilis]
MARSTPTPTPLIYTMYSLRHLYGKLIKLASSSNTRRTGKLCEVHMAALEETSRFGKIEGYRTFALLALEIAKHQEMFNELGLRFHFRQHRTTMCLRFESQRKLPGNLVRGAL